MNKYSQSENTALNAKLSSTMNSSSQGGSGFDPELKAKIEALEKQQAMQRRCPSCGESSTSQRLTCHNCGNYYDRGANQTAWDLKQAALGKAVAETEEDEQLAALKSYLIKRTTAKLIDCVIVGSIVAMEFLTYFGLVKAFSGIPECAPLMLTVLYWFMPILTVISVLGYQAAFEASPVQATPGKLVMGLYLVSVDGKQMAPEPLVLKGLPFCLAVPWFCLRLCLFFLH